MSSLIPDAATTSNVPVQVKNTKPSHSQQFPHKLLLIAVSLPVIIVVFCVAFWFGAQFGASTKLTQKNDEGKQSAQPQITPLNTLVPTTSQIASKANVQTYKITHDPTVGYPDYSVSIPQKWVRQEHSSNFQDLETFLALDGSALVIQTDKNPKTTLSNYLDDQDKIAKTAWEGTPSVTVLSSIPKTIQNFEAVERFEDKHAAGFTARVTYVSYKDTIFIFYNRPGQIETPESEALQYYDTIVESLRITP